MNGQKGHPPAAGVALIDGGRMLSYLTLYTLLWLLFQNTEPLAAVVETQQQQIEQQQQQIDALRREQQEQQKLMAEMMQHQLDQPDTVKLLGTVVDLEQVLQFV